MTAIWELPTDLSRKHKKAIRRTAWNDISPESIIRRFKKWCVSNDIAGTEVVFCRRKTIKTTLLPVMKMLFIVSGYLTGVSGICYNIDTPKF
jgi:hypothetical protein